MFKTLLIFVICMMCICATPQPATKPDAQLTDVEIDNFTFKPQRLVIHKGTRVRWINKDDVPHTATSNDRKFDSKTLDTDESFTFQFQTVGEFRYFCAVHPHMTGEIVVKE
jgi:plastocyanin